MKFALSITSALEALLAANDGTVTVTVDFTPPPIVVVGDEVAQFCNRLLSPPNEAWAAIYHAFIDGLVVDKVWAKLRGLFLLGAADAPSSLVDLTPTASIPYLTYGGGTLAFFTPKVGWTNANLHSLQLGYSPLLDAANFAQNDHCVFVDVSASHSSATGSTFYEIDEAASLTQHLEVGLNYINFRAGGPNVAVGPLAPETGFFLGQRTSPSDIALYRDNILVNAQGSNPSITIPGGEITLRGTQTRGLVGYGTSLDAGERSALWNRWQTAKTAIAALP